MSHRNIIELTDSLPQAIVIEEVTTFDSPISQNQAVTSYVVDGSLETTEIIYDDSINIVEFPLDRIDDNILFSAVQEKRWEFAQDLIQDHCNNNRIVHFTDKWNKWTTLHIACYEREIPIWFFQNLVSLYHATDDGTPIVDCWGDTALHVACKFASDEMILILLEKFSTAASIQNKHGGLPLHDAINYERCPDVLNALLECYPNAIHTQNKHKVDPLGLFLQTEKTFHNSQKKKLLYKGDTDTICEVLTLLVRYSTGNYVLDDSFSVRSFSTLLASIQKQIPIRFVELILSMFPEEMSTEDENGQYAIHIASAVVDHSYRYELLKLFCTRFPKSVSIPNRDGKLPISVLLESPNVSIKEVSMVFKTCTFVSGTRDVTNHLYPFLLALTQSRRGDKLSPTETKPGDVPEGNCNKNKLSNMNISFLMLTENPAIMRHCI